MFESDVEIARIEHTDRNIRKFEKLCTELSRLAMELNLEDIEVLYHTERGMVSLVKDGVLIVEVGAPLMTLWD